jgi:hypothetical protein
MGAVASQQSNRRRWARVAACGNARGLMLEQYGAPRIPSRAMPKKPIQWEVYRPIKGSPGAFVGIVEASDEKSALKAAIEEFEIINPEHQNRLFVLTGDRWIVTSRLRTYRRGDGLWRIAVNVRKTDRRLHRYTTWPDRPHNNLDHRILWHTQARAHLR